MATARVGRLTRERRRELTRTALIEAAADLFATRGFHATSLEEIAQAAGFTRGAIYKNFSSKDDLLLAVADWYGDLHMDAFEQRMSGSPDATISGRAAAGADVFGSLVLREPSQTLLMLELRLHGLRNPEFRERMAARDRAQAERVAGFIADQARQAGVNLQIEPGDLADLLLPACEGLMQAVAVNPDDAEKYDRITRLFFQLIENAAYVQGQITAKKRGGARPQD